MPSWQAWIFWSLAGLLALGGGWLIVRALFLDRARGRRRCGRCWYDMSHSAGLLCSECGFEARAERSLFRTRRHWWQAALGLGLMIVAAPAALWPVIQQHGWAHITPTTLLIYVVSTDDLLAQSRMQQQIVMFPGLGPGGLKNDPFVDELLERIAAGSLSEWQFNLLIDRHLGKDWPISKLTINHGNVWPAHQPFFAPTMLDMTPPAELLTFGSIRIRLRPHGDADFEPVRVSEQWPGVTSYALEWSVAQRLVNSAPTGNPIVLDVLVERRPTAGSGEPWEVVRTRTLTLPVKVEGDIDQFVEVDRTAAITASLLSDARVIFDNVRGAIYFDRADPPMLERMIVPARIELLRDGEPVHAWDALVDSEERQWSLGETHPGRPLEYPVDVKPIDRPFATANYRDFRWSVRITGLPSFAILAPEETLAWEGTFTIPLELVETRERLCLTYQQGAVSGGSPDRTHR
jgi:hypothetical protein